MDYFNNFSLKKQRLKENTENTVPCAMLNTSSGFDTRYLLWCRFLLFKTIILRQYKKNEIKCSA